MMLQDKKVLFLSAAFFGYEHFIIQRLIQLGAQVRYFNERPSDSVWTKGIIRARKKWYSHLINQYYRTIIHKIEGHHFDYLLLIKGETVPLWFLELFKKRYPGAVMIYYSYDTVLEYPKSVDLTNFFDRIFTFEPADAKNYNWHFRPLFSVSEYQSDDIDINFQNDITFIGSAHTDRYLIGKQVKSLADKLELRSFFYYYVQGRLAFWLKRIFDPTFKQFDPACLSFKKLSHKEIAAIYRNSHTVLDINKPFQVGLTMRTFEALAAQKKLITTNADIKNYPFYSPENILIINRENVQLPRQFFKSRFVPLADDQRQMMSLDSWLYCLFIQPQDEYWKDRHHLFSAGFKI